jgi:hypothetical protein
MKIRIVMGMCEMQAKLAPFSVLCCVVRSCTGVTQVRPHRVYVRI